ncbi:MAG: TRAP transporter small permease subunit [Thiotrichaceae bacterium]
MITGIKILIRSIDALNEWVGRSVSWLVLAIVLLVCYDITMRYLLSAGILSGFSHNSGALQELQWHFFALIFLLGGAYTLKHDEHVRVDIVYQSSWMNSRQRALVNFIGSSLFLIPFCLIIIYSSYPFVYDSYLHHETSPDAGGLTHRYLLKLAIPLGFSLLLLQGISQSLTNLLLLLGYRVEDK